MVLIEFLNEQPLENIASSLILQPDRVIFIGTDKAALNHWRSVYDSDMQRRGMKQASVELVRFDNMEESLNRFQKLYDRIGSDDIWFDVLGGKEDALIGFGRFMESNPDVENWHLVVPDMKQRVMRDAISGKIISTEENRKARLIDIGEYVSLYDTSWIHNESTESHIYEKEDDRELIENLWDASYNLRKANWHEYFVPNKKFIIEKRVFGNQEIVKKRTLEDYSHIHREVMEKSGNLFEMYTAAEVYNVMQSDRRQRVWQSVTMDWDGKRTLTKEDVYNEIDVISFYGYCPVFISCKAGVLKDDEIFKLYSVSHHFGGKYVIAGIVKAGKISGIRKERLNEMGMFYIENVNNMSHDDFRKKLQLRICGIGK